MEFDDTVIVALGANLPSHAGPPERTLEAALDALSLGGTTISCASRLYRTPCFPAGAGPDYVNAAALVEGCDNPPALLAILHRIEDDFGRRRERRWGMRSLDLDLIAFGRRVLPDRAGYLRWRNLAPEAQRRLAPEQLILPHPRLHERAFVLVPLAEIAPGWRHPVTGETAAAMLAALPEADRAAVRAL